MKAFAFVLAICIIGAFAETEEERHENIRTQCATEHNIGEDVIGRLMKGQWAMEDPGFQCYFKCIMTKEGVMREDGSLNMEKLKETTTDDFPADKVQHTIDTCTVMTGANACEKAAKIAKCFADQTYALAHAE